MCEEKYIEAQSAKPSTATQVIDELIGNEEQNGTQKKEKNRERVPEVNLMQN